MHIQFVTDAAGKQQAVQIPIREWKQYEKELTQLKRKVQLLTDLKAAAREVRQIEAGKSRGKLLKNLLDEL
ncbi:MAG: hypothetical protein JSS75_10350 [Bacteroidetes bacterium]|nr:hypothetical protein [Bacteroidota bacterium]